MTEEAQTNEAPQEGQTETPQSEPVQSNVDAKAGIGKRVIAVIVDALIMIPVWYIFYAIHLSFLGSLIMMAYAFLKDGINFAGLDNRSVGKKVMGLRVINRATGKRCSYVDSLLRQIVFIIPILNILIVIVELVLVITDSKGIRLGDKIAKTMVIEEA